MTTAQDQALTRPPSPGAVPMPTPTYPSTITATEFASDRLMRIDSLVDALEVRVNAAMRTPEHPPAMTPTGDRPGCSEITARVFTLGDTADRIADRLSAIIDRIDL